VVTVRSDSTSVKVSVKTKGNVKVTVNVTNKSRERKPLRFGSGNAKLDAAIFTFSLPAGHTCPFAKDCKAKADRHTGKLQDGPETEFRCYAASMEARHSSVRTSRWHNLQALRGCRSKEEMVALILDSLSPFAGYIRVHDSGDYFSQDYFDAWLEAASRRPHTTFYFYTKSVRYWLARLAEVGDGHTPGNVPNFVPTASLGGRDDELVLRHGLRTARVVYSEQEAADLGLEIDHDDSHAMRHGPDFALLVHGTQPPGSEASKAVQALRNAGNFGYGRQHRQGRLPLVLLDERGKLS
jgi:hypothetical protein